MLKRLRVTSLALICGLWLVWGCTQLRDQAKSGEILAVSLTDGTIKWRVEALTATVAKPLMSNGTLIVAGNDDCNRPDALLVAYDINDGSVRWRQPIQAYCGSVRVERIGDTAVSTSGPHRSAFNINTGAPVASPPFTPEGSTLSIATEESGDGVDLTAHDIASGKLWRIHLGDVTVMCPWATDGEIVVTAVAPADSVSEVWSLVGLSVRDGSMRWMRSSSETSPWIRQPCPLLARDVIVVRNEDPAARGLEALRPSDGTTLWTTDEVTDKYPSVHSTSGIIVLTYRDDGVDKAVAYNLRSGDVAWRLQRSSRECCALSLIGLSENAVYFWVRHGSTSAVWSYASDTGEERWNLDLKGPASIEFAALVTIVASGDEVVALSGETNSELWRLDLDGDHQAAASVEGTTAYIAVDGDPIPCSGFSC